MTSTTMTKKRAREIISQVARNHARKWLDNALAAGEIYYLIESVSNSGMYRRITLAVACISTSDGTPRAYLDFFWPNPVGTADEEQAALQLLDYSEALDVAAKTLDFSIAKRCFAVGGCGMDMVFATVTNLAAYAYRPHGEGATEADKAAFKRCGSLSRTSMGRV